MNPPYRQMTLGTVLQWHMPERYLIACISQQFETGILTEPSFMKVCSTTWGNKIIKDWRTAQIMDVVDAAPAFLTEWSEAVKAEELCYPQMPTNYAENANKQWCFGRVLITTPKLLGLFKQLVAEKKLNLPKEDSAEVTEEHLKDV